MSSTSNQLTKPKNVVNAPGEILKIHGKTTFVMNYGQWLEEHKRLVSDIRSALNDHDKLQFLIDTVMKHHFELFKMKTVAANVDVFNAVSAIWSRTSEHDLWWIGGFRPSEILQGILPKLQHLCSQQQLSDIYNFGQLCEQAEEALAQGMEKLQQILDKAIAAGDKGIQLTYVPQQVTFFQQADLLREQFLYQFCGLLTISQQAEFLLALGERLHKSHPRSSL